VIDQIETLRLAAFSVVRASGDLDQAAPAILPPTARLSIAQIFATFVSTLSSDGPLNLTHIVKLARLMTDLCNERGSALRAYYLVMLRGGVHGGNKNARLGAGVGEDLQQLLLGDGHCFSPGKKKPAHGRLFSAK
jgi:hypothetical protein